MTTPFFLALIFWAIAWAFNEWLVRFEPRSLALRRQGIRNSRLAGEALRTHSRLPQPAAAALKRLLHRSDLSSRGLDRLLRLARTIADLAGSDRIHSEHVAEAFGYAAGVGTPGL